MRWWPAECEAGDMVRVAVGSVWHYGIFVSENEIIQFGPPPAALSKMCSEDISVCSATAEEFSCGSIIEKAVLDRSERKKRLPPEKTVELARSRIGEGGYSLLHNNCEHFANECVFGIKRSSQEEEAKARWENRPILDVYIAAIPEEIEIAPLACREREEEIAKTGNVKLKNARYLDWQVLMYAASRSMGLDCSSLHFSKQDNGKWCCGEFYFSLSHTEGAVAVAVSNGRVGVDIENEAVFEKKPYAQGEKRKRLFKRIAAEEEETGEADFLSLWLKKESIFKCVGKGSSPISVDTRAHRAEVYNLKRLPDYRFAVCGDKLQNVRFYLYENGTARSVNSEITKSESQE